jgi:hypothetical protein
VIEPLRGTPWEGTTSYARLIELLRNEALAPGMPGAAG